MDVFINFVLVMIFTAHDIFLYSVLADQILFLSFSTILPTLFRAVRTKPLSSLDAWLKLCMQSPYLNESSGEWWWDGECWLFLGDFILVLGDKDPLNVSFSATFLLCLVITFVSFGICFSSGKLSVLSVDHTKRSSHKLLASIFVVVVVVVFAAVEFRNTRFGSFYSADDFYRGVPSPSVRLLRASYSMTSW